MVEVLTGLALVASPPFLAWLIFGQDFPAGADAVARIAGLGLIGCAVACWYWPNPTGRRAILWFQPLVAVPLIGLALVMPMGGPLLWPAILYHVAAGAMLARTR